MADVLDVLIVGGGAAGYTAGLFAARDRCRALLLEKFSSGGQVLNCEHITNFPGFPQGVAGYTLGPLLQEQATAAGPPDRDERGHRGPSRRRSPGRSRPTGAPTLPAP